MTFALYYCNEGIDGEFHRMLGNKVMTYDSLEHGVLSNRYGNPDHVIVVQSDTEFVMVRPCDGVAIKFVAIEDGEQDG